MASLIGGIFGKGGGNEVNSALSLQAFDRRFGAAKGRRAWSGFRSKNDPEAPTTVAKRFPYQTGRAFAKRGLALPDPGSVDRHPGGAAARGAPAARPRIPDDGSIGAQLMRALAQARRTPPTGSWSAPSTPRTATRSR